jgi:hypothetical protein
MALTTITKDFIVKSGLRVEGSNSVTTSTAGIGTLSVNGGAAVAGNIIVGSTASIYGATTIQNILNVAGDVTVNSGKAVITAASGNIYTQGNVDVEGTFNSTGTISLNNLFTVNGTSGNVFASGTGYFGGAVGVEGTFNSTGTLSVNTNKFTVDAASGNLSTKGTGYFAGAVGVQGAFNSTGTLSVNDLFSVAGTTGNLSTKGTVYAQGDAGFGANVSATGTIVTINSNNVTNQSTTGTAAVSIKAGGLYVNKSAWIDGSTAASAGANGALVVQYGGAYIGDNIYVASTANDDAILTNNSIYTAGGLGVAKNLGVGGSVTINGNLTVLGTQTIVNSTSTAIQSPILDLGTNADNAPLTLDDGYNKGLVIHYYDTDDNHMFLGRNDTSGHLELRHNIAPGFHGAIPNAYYVNSGTYASMDLGSLIVNDSTVSTNYQSGSLQVLGGVGVTGDIYLRNETGTYNKLYGTATQADNLNLGAEYQIPYQTGIGATSFIDAPTADNQVLSYTEASGLYWGEASATTVGRATTATNIDGGTAGQISYQTAPGLTSFFGPGTAGQILVSNGAAAPEYTTTSSIAVGFADTAGQLLPANTGTQYVGFAGRADAINPDNTGTQYVGFAGRADAINPDNTGTQYVGFAGRADAINPANTGTQYVAFAGRADAINPANTGTQYVAFAGRADAINPANTSTQYVGFAGRADAINPANTSTQYVGNAANAVHAVSADLATTATNIAGGSANQVPYQSAPGATTFSSNLTFDGTSLAVGGSGGNITLSGGNISGATDITGSGAVQGATLVATSTAPTLGGSETGALGVTGGAKIAKDLYVGTTATVAGTLFVDNDVTINADLYVEGTIFVKGNELTGLDQISGSTATFANLIVNNTATVANLKVNNTATIGDLTVTGQFNVNGYSLGSFANIYSTATAYLNNVSITGTTTATNLQLTSTLDHGYGFNNVDTTSSQAWSLATAGGIFAFKNITAGGVVSAGDQSTLTGNDTGSVDAFYAVNNIQAARTISNISGSATKEIDRWDKTHFTSAKYLVQIVDDGDIYVSEFMIVTDGTTYNYISEYGNVSNNGDLGAFTVTDSGENLIFSFTPAGATSMTIQVVRQSILTALEIFC